MHYLIAFLGGMALGGILELLVMFVIEAITKKPLRITHRYSLWKKISLFSLPIWGVIGLLAVSDVNVLKLFIVSALVGTVLEFLLGRGLKTIFGIKLWTYKHGQLGQFTSIYSFPYWGGAGFVFLALAKLLQLS